MENIKSKSQSEGQNSSLMSEIVTWIQSSMDKIGELIRDENFSGITYELRRVERYLLSIPNAQWTDTIIEKLLGFESCVTKIVSLCKQLEEFDHAKKNEDKVSRLRNQATELLRLHQDMTNDIKRYSAVKADTTKAETVKGQKLALEKESRRLKDEYSTLQAEKNALQAAKEDDTTENDQHIIKLRDEIQTTKQKAERTTKENEKLKQQVSTVIETKKATARKLQEKNDEIEELSSKNKLGKVDDSFATLKCGHGMGTVLERMIDIKVNSIKIIPNPDDPKKHLINFKFDAHVAGEIKLCFSSFMVGGYDESPKLDLLPAITERVPMNLEQSFVQPGEGITFPLYEIGWREIYTLVIKALPDLEDESGDRICQTTMIVFDVTEGVIVARSINQSINIKGSSSVCFDMGFPDNPGLVRKENLDDCLICHLSSHPGMYPPLHSGKLVLSDKRIEGTNSIVYEGNFKEMLVAVKRIDKSRRKEIQLRLGANSHQNILRVYTTADRGSYFYIALEFCDRKLSDLLSSSSEGSTNLKLWDAKGHPSDDLFKLIKQICDGIAYSHMHQICNLKIDAEHILITEGTPKIPNYSISTEISDNGEKIDMLNLGSLIANILTKGKLDLMSVNIHGKEAVDLVSSLKCGDLTSAETTIHPTFWGRQKRLYFFRDAFEYVRDDGAPIAALEVQTYRDWNTKFQQPSLNTYLATHNTYVASKTKKKKTKLKYNYQSGTDLLRFIRNSICHPKDLSDHLKGLSGKGVKGKGDTVGFYQLFTGSFPCLLMDVYKALQGPVKQESAKEELLLYNNYYK